MMCWWNEPKRRQRTAWVAALCLTAPLLALPAAPAAAQGTRRPGMSTRQKLVVLAGAALVYYLYRKHQAQRAEQARLQQRQTGVGQGGTPVARRMPQLYRSRNGGVYYRDPNNPQRVVWLTAPTRSLQVPAEDVQRYAPDYTRYRGPAPAIPRGARSESFEEFNSSLFDDTNYTTRGSGGSMPGGGNMTGGGMPPGPGR